MKKQKSSNMKLLKNYSTEKNKTIKLFLRKKKIEINYITFLSTNERKRTIFSEI